MTIYHQVPSKWILHTEDKMLAVLLLLVTLQNLVAAQTILSVPNGVSEGDWGPMEVCDPGTRAKGFDLKVEEWQDILDDTALNGIRLYCTEPSSPDVIKKITSKEGDFGTWGKYFSCDTGFLTRFSLRVETGDQIDKTAANNIKFGCSDGSIKEGDGQEWGDYGPWSKTCSEGIRGIQTRVMPKRGAFRDDLSLTDVKFTC
ncbi:vitelline membrane outer layer protein 1-like [Phyllobates terribilis]|uniref:vitelline membrane outer layer protein 1-like n=1 Tax=Phyllobates terribilis TaxID=111132 RepID=UPI003CCB61AC